MKKIIYFLTLIMLLLMVSCSRKEYSSEVLYPLKDWVEIANNIYVNTGEYFKVNSVLVVDGKEAVLIDTGYDKIEGERIKNFIDENDITLKNIIITHNHSDHTSNISLFNLPNEMIIKKSSNSDGIVIKVGDKNLRLIDTYGHNLDNHLSVEIVEDNILVAGDVYVTNLLPLLNYGGTSKLKSTLMMIKEKNYNIIIPGHGDIIDTKSGIKRQIDYIDNVEKAIVKLNNQYGKPIDKNNLREFQKYLNSNINVFDCIPNDLNIDFNIDKAASDHKLNIRVIADYILPQKDN